MGHKRILELDQVVHAPVRLAIMSILAAVDEAEFTFLRESTGTTDGNLSTHLARLEKSGYIAVKKTFKGKKPNTVCSMTYKGRKAFKRYLDQLESLLNDQKGREEK